MKFFVSVFVVALKCSFILAQVPSFTFRDEFNGPKEELDSTWISIRDTKLDRYSLTKSPGYLVLNTYGSPLTSQFDPSFYALPVKHPSFEASTAMKFVAAEHEDASIVVFRTNRRHFVFGKFLYKGNQHIYLLKAHIFPDERDTRRYMILGDDKLPVDKLLAPVMLKVTKHDGKFAFYYAFEKDKWIKMKDNIDATYLDVEPESESGTLVGMYSTSHALRSFNSASFDWFEYLGFDN